MNLIRLIIITVAAWLAFHMMRRLLKHLSPPAKSESAPKNMVRCAKCGLHLPEAEAVAYEGQYYCCQEHRRQHTGHS